MEHSDACPRPLSRECLKFSTDGTKLGSEIAHTMGTDDEDEIKNQPAEGSAAWIAKHCMTGMDSEQAEWESEDVSSWQ